MTYAKRRYADILCDGCADILVDVGATRASSRIVVNSGPKAGVYAPMPDKHLERTRELARQWKCSEWEAMNRVWKCGQNPRRKGEGKGAYVKRIKNLPDIRAFFVA